MRTKILPKGIPLHEDISLESINVYHIFRSIHKDRFSGYFRIYLNNTNGVIFYRKGEVFFTFFEDDDKKEAYTGDDSVPLVRSLYKMKDVHISLYCFNEDNIPMLTSILTNKAIYKNLDTGFVNLNKMLVHLGSIQFTGLMELKVFNSDDLSGLLFQKGSIIDGFIYRSPDNVAWGPENGARVLENAFRMGAVFNVYEGIDEKRKGSRIPEITIPDIESLLNICMEVIITEIRAHTKYYEIDHLFLDALNEVADNYPFLSSFTKKMMCYKGEIKLFLDSNNIATKELFRCIDDIFTHFLSGELFETPTLLFQIQNNLKKTIASPKNRRFAKMANRYLPSLFSNYVHLI